MKKNKVSIIAKIFVIAVVLSLLIVLCINLFTLWSVTKIENGKEAKFGLSLAIVGSGSMEPTISVNDLLLIKKSESYQRDDIVTYLSERGSLITHRVTEVLDDGYITQGDANNIPDEKISKQRVLGETVFVIPFVGNIIFAFFSVTGLVILICSFLLILLLQRLWGNKDEYENKKNDGKTALQKKRELV